MEDRVNAWYILFLNRGFCDRSFIVKKHLEQSVQSVNIRMTDRFSLTANSMLLCINRHYSLNSLIDLFTNKGSILAQPSSCAAFSFRQ